MPANIRFIATGGLLVAGVVGLTVVASRSRQRAVAAAASLRTSSAPSARLYDALFSRLLAGLYDRMADDAVSRVADLPAPRVLEVGLGPGELAVRIAARHPGLLLTGLDVDVEMLRLARDRVARAALGDRVELVEGRVEALPFEDASFDLVVSSFSAHHWSDGAAGFAEIRRVLRPGARALVYDLPDAWGHFETGARGLADAAAAGGFEIARAEPLRWPWRIALVRRLAVTQDQAPTS